MTWMMIGSCCPTEETEQTVSFFLYNVDMAKKENKTNAMRMLENAGIAYQVHTYDTEDGLIDGVSVALKCHEDPDLQVCSYAKCNTFALLATFSRIQHACSCYKLEPTSIASSSLFTVCSYTFCEP